MKNLILPALLVFGLSACDSRDFDSDTFALSKVEFFDVAYEVTGTYSNCSISYVTIDRSIKTVSTALPWSKEAFTVRVAGTDDLFNAAVSATCHDDNRFGKSTVSVFVDEELKSRGATTGFGQTAEAEFLLFNSNR